MSAAQAGRRRDLSGGARVRFQDGRAVLQPASATPEDAAAALVSIISPGTELRRLRATIGGSAREAGYMTIARHPATRALFLAPVAHGSWIDPGHPEALLTRFPAAAEIVAAARFQLIAAVGMRHRAFPASVRQALVIGSGPVALGCCLELRRRGVPRLKLVTRRAEVSFAAGLDAEVTCRLPRSSAALVVDAAADVARAAQAVAVHGTLALVGSPDRSQALSAELVHRRGVTVLGMHELAGYDHASYQDEFSAVLSWLSASFDTATLGSWCLRISEAEVVSFYRCLGSAAGRQAQPITLLQWR